MIHENLALLFVRNAKTLKEHRHGTRKSLAECNADREFTGLREIEFSRKRYVAILRLVELKLHLVMVRDIGIPVTLPDVSARKPRELTRCRHCEPASAFLSDK